jgi:hypothetical protein
MPKSSQHPRNNLNVFCSSSTAGPVTLSFPASVEQEHMSSAAPIPFSSALPPQSECTFAFHSSSAHIVARSSVPTSLTIVGPDLVVSRDTFPAGNLHHSSQPTTDINEETVFLTIATQNQVSTEISMIAKICSGYSVSLG